MTTTIHILPVFADDAVSEVWFDTGLPESTMELSTKPTRREWIRATLHRNGIALVEDGGTVAFVRIGQPDCSRCQGPEPHYGPGHYFVSAACRSGKKPHCTCRACW